VLDGSAVVAPTNLFVPSTPGPQSKAAADRESAGADCCGHPRVVISSGRVLGHASAAPLRRVW
jgi:hypothetical protein